MVRVTMTGLLLVMWLTFLAWEMALADAGDPDPTFGTGGRVIISVSSWSDEGCALVMQPNGKFIVAGSGQNGTFLAMARYNKNGKLDHSFGSLGKVISDVTDNTDWGYAVALQSDCKIVVAGASYSGGGPAFAVTRYLLDEADHDDD